MLKTFLCYLCMGMLNFFEKPIEKRSAVVEWLECLSYGAESRRNVVSSKLGFAMRQLENFVCQPNSKCESFLN